MKEKQIQLLEKAMRLSQENPDAEIHVCVASDELLEDYAWTGHVIIKVELAYWYVHGEKIYIDPSELWEELCDRAADDGREEPTVEQVEAMMTPAVIIYTGA